MPTTADFLNSIFDKAGIASDDPDRVSVLSASDLAKVGIPDTLLERVAPRLLSIEDAKVHPDVRKHVAGTAIGGVQDELKALAKEMGVEGDDYNEVFGGANQRLMDRVKTLVQKQVALERKKATADTPEEKAKLTAKIAELQKQAESASGEWKAKYEAAIQESGAYRQQVEAERLQSRLLSVLPLDKINDAIPANMRTDIALRTVLEATTASGAKIVSTPTGLKLMQADAPDVEYFDTAQNKRVSLADFATDALKKAQLIVDKTAGPTPPVVVQTQDKPPIRNANSHAAAIHQQAANSSLGDLRKSLGRN